MGDVPGQVSFRRQLAAQFEGRWQIPLLVVSLGLLAWGVWRMRPVTRPPGFEELYARAAALKDAGLYLEANSFTQQLLIDPARTDAERRKLNGLMAEIIFGHERGNVVHGEGNCRLILEHSDRSLGEGEAFTAAEHRMRALALEWLRRPSEAAAEYERALASGLEEPWPVRKRILELRSSAGLIEAAELRGALDALVAAGEAPAEIRHWAAERIIDLLVEAGDYGRIEEFLAANAAVFALPDWRNEHAFLTALARYHTGRADEAEQMLRVLRDALAPGDPLYARSGWLLGRILLEAGQPAAALSVYDDVIAAAVPGPYVTSCIAGRGEALADLERHGEAIEAYNEAIRRTTEEPYGSRVDLQAVRESATDRSRRLQRAGRLIEARGFLELAARLAPPADERLAILYCQSLADLLLEIGQRMLSQPQGDAAAGLTGADQGAAWYLSRAGEEYLRLAKLTTLDAERSTAAAWRAGDAFDLAGRRERTAEVLEAFVRERPESVRVPEALLRLGQAYQAAGRYEQAIEKYQENLTRFPRTPAALESLVPLADCFAQLGRQDAAETTLLRIVEPSYGDAIDPILPVAREYRDALYALADLYSDTGRHEEAISRYEEALERYPEDRRSDGARFLLANAYRLSAAAIREAIEDPRNVAVRDDLRLKYGQRLQRAAELFTEVVQRYEGRSPESLSDLERLYARLSHFYRADAVFDQSYLTGGSDLRPYARAVEMYDRAAWIYQHDPAAMSAYIQMINCHLRLGNADEARKTLNRARWALRNISDEQFARHSPAEGRAYWDEYLSWLERTPALRPPRTPAPAAMARAPGG